MLRLSAAGLSTATRRLWHGLRRGRRRFRRWRRGRPFWGGLLLMLAGGQLFLSTQLDPLHVEISFGPEGFLTLLLPLVLLLCGVLVWITPQHRHFYSVIGTVTAIYSLLGLNLGGWFVGMLLGIVGGALSFAWTPLPQPSPRPPVPQPSPTPPPAEGNPPEADYPPEVGDWFGGSDHHTNPQPPPRTQVAVALPLLLVAALAVPAEAPAAAGAQCLIPIPLLCPDPPPEPDPPPDPTPGPGESPEPTPPPSPAPSPGPDDGDGADEDPDPEDEGEVPRLERETGLPLISAEPARMTADRLRQDGFRFEGITEVTTTAGAVEVLKFSFRRATSANFTLTTTGDGDPAVVTADPLVLAGDVTFYTSRFSGRLAGIPLELTPDSPLVLLLELIQIPLDVTFTDVDLDLVFTAGAELTATGFVLTA